MESKHGLFSICPICLSKDRILHILEDGLLYLAIILDIFDKETSKQAVCWECYANLRKISKFKQTALQAQMISKENPYAKIQNVSLSTLKKITHTDVITVTAEESVEDTKKPKLSLNLLSQLSPLLPEYPPLSQYLLSQQTPLSVPPSLLQLSLGSLQTHLISLFLSLPSPPSLLQISLGALQTHLTSPPLPPPSLPSLLQLSLGSLQTHLPLISPSLPSPSLPSECSILQNIIPSPKSLSFLCSMECFDPSPMAPLRPKSLPLTQSLLPPSSLLASQPSLPQQSSSPLQSLLPKPVKSSQRSRMSRPKPSTRPLMLQSSSSNVKLNLNVTKIKRTKITTKPVYILVGKTKTTERKSLSANLRRSATLTKPNTTTYIRFVADERMINKITKLRVVNFSKKTPKSQRHKLGKKNYHYQKTNSSFKMKKPSVETIIISDSESDDLLSGNFSDPEKPVYVSSNDESESENVEWLEDSAQESDDDVELICNDPKTINIVQTIKEKKNEQEKNKQSNQQEMVTYNLENPTKSSSKTATNISDNRCVQENKKSPFIVPLQLHAFTNLKKNKNQQEENKNMDERGIVGNNLTSCKYSSSKKNNPQNITAPNDYENVKTCESIELLSNTKNIGCVDSLTHSKESFTIFKISEYMSDNAKKPDTVVQILPKILGMSSKNLHDLDKKQELVLHHPEQKQNSVLHRQKTSVLRLKDKAIISPVLARNINQNILSNDNNKDNYIQKGIGKTKNGQDVNKARETKIVTDTNVAPQLQHDKMDYDFCLTQNNTHLEPLDRAIFINENLVNADEKPCQALDEKLVTKPQLHVSKIGIPDKNIFVIGRNQKYVAMDKNSQRLHETQGIENDTDETLHVQVIHNKICQDSVCNSKIDKKVDDTTLSRHIISDYDITPDILKCSGKDINGSVSNETQKADNETGVTNMTPGINTHDKMGHDQMYLTQSDKRAELLDGGFLIIEKLLNCNENPRKDTMKLVAMPQLPVNKITAGPLYKDSAPISEQLDVMGIDEQLLIRDRDSLTSNKTQEVENITDTIIHTSHYKIGYDPLFVEKNSNSQGLKETEEMKNNKEICFILQKQVTHEKVGNEQVFIAQNDTHIEPLEPEKFTKVKPQNSIDNSPVLLKEFKTKPQLFINKITSDMPWKNNLNTKNTSEIQSIPKKPVKRPNLDSLKAFYTVLLDHSYCKGDLWKRARLVVRNKFSSGSRSKLKINMKNQVQINDLHANNGLVDKDSNVTAVDESYVSKSPSVDLRGFVPESCSNKKNEDSNISNIQYDADERDQNIRNYSGELRQINQEETKSEITDTASEIDDFEHIKPHYNYRIPIDNKCTAPIINCKLTDTNYGVPVENDAAPSMDNQQPFLGANIGQNFVAEKETSHEHDKPTESDINLCTILTVSFPYPDSFITESDEDKINELNDHNLKNQFDDLKNNPEHGNLKENLLEPLYYVDWEDETYKHVTEDNKTELYDAKETQVYMNVERQIGKRSAIRPSTRKKRHRKKKSLERRKNNRLQYVSHKKAILTAANSNSEMISTVDIPYSSSTTESNINGLSLVSEVPNLKELIDYTVKQSFEGVINDNKNINYNHHKTKSIQIKVDNDIDKKQALRPNTKKKKCRKRKSLERSKISGTQNKNKLNSDFLLAFKRLNMDIRDDDINRQVKDDSMLNSSLVESNSNNILNKKRKRADSNDVEKDSTQKNKINEISSLHTVVPSKPNYKSKQKRTKRDNKRDKDIIIDNNSSRNVSDFGNSNPNETNNGNDSNKNFDNINVTNFIANHLQITLNDVENSGMTDKLNCDKSKYMNEPINGDEKHSSEKVTENLLPETEINLDTKQINYDNFTERMDIEDFLPCSFVMSKKNKGLNRLDNKEKDSEKVELESETSENKIAPTDFIENNKVITLDDLDEDFCFDEFVYDKVGKIESPLYETHSTFNNDYTNRDERNMKNLRKFNRSLYVSEVIDENEALRIKEKYKGDNYFVNAIYKCYLCVQAFASKKNWFHHVKWHETPGRFVCSVCSVGFHSNASLSLHIPKHFRCYKCNWCDVKYTSIAPLKHHVSRSHAFIYNALFNKLTVACDRCDKRFFKKHMLLSHKCSIDLGRQKPRRRRIRRKRLLLGIDTAKNNSSENSNSLENNTWSTKNISCSIENNSCSTENNTSSTTNNSCFTENNLCSAENNICTIANLQPTRRSRSSSCYNLRKLKTYLIPEPNDPTGGLSVTHPQDIGEIVETLKKPTRKVKVDVCVTENIPCSTGSVTENDSYVTENKTCLAKDNISSMESNLYEVENNARLMKNSVCSMENNLCMTNNNASLMENNSYVTENNASLVENNLLSTGNNLCVTKNEACSTSDVSLENEISSTRTTEESENTANEKATSVNSDYNCFICEQIFYNYDVLLSHQTSKHEIAYNSSGLKTQFLRCFICQAGYKMFPSLYNHQQRCHKKIRFTELRKPTETMPKTCDSREKMLSENAFKIYACFICKDWFKNYSELLIHQNNYHLEITDKNESNNDDKDISTHVSISNVTNEYVDLGTNKSSWNKWKKTGQSGNVMSENNSSKKRYMCYLCNYRFVSFSSLISHQKRKHWDAKVIQSHLKQEVL